MTRMIVFEIIFVTRVIIFVKRMIIFMIIFATRVIIFVTSMQQNMNHFKINGKPKSVRNDIAHD